MNATSQEVGLCDENFKGRRTRWHSEPSSFQWKLEDNGHLLEGLRHSRCDGIRLMRQQQHTWEASVHKTDSKWEEPG